MFFEITRNWTSKKIDIACSVIWSPCVVGFWSSRKYCSHSNAADSVFEFDSMKLQAWVLLSMKSGFSFRNSTHRFRRSLWLICFPIVTSWSDTDANKQLPGINGFSLMYKSWWNTSFTVFAWWWPCVAESKLEKCHQFNVVLVGLWKKMGYREGQLFRKMVRQRWEG